MVWSSIDVKTIVGAQLVDPHEVIKPFILDHSIRADPAGMVDSASALHGAVYLTTIHALGTAEADTLLRVQQLAAARWVIASFMSLAQVLRIVGVGLQSRALYQQRLLAGEEPPVNLGGEPCVLTIDMKLDQRPRKAC